MASRRLPGAGLRSTWAGAPDVAVIMHPNRGGVGLKSTFDGAPLDEQRCRTITEVTLSRRSGGNVGGTVRGVSVTYAVHRGRSARAMVLCVGTSNQDRPGNGRSDRKQRHSLPRFAMQIQRSLLPSSGRSCW
jgi:hypothetical protein